MYSVRMPNSVESRTISSTSSRVAGLVLALASTETTPGGPPCSRIASTSRPILRLAQSRGTKPLRVVAWSSGRRNWNDARRPPVVPPERELQRLLADVLAEQDDLVALEDVGNPARDQVPGAPARPPFRRRASIGIGEHRAAEPLEDDGDFHLDVLAGEDERGGRPALVGDLLEERRVDIDARRRK